ncbi:MAG TPA: hypothetical protein VMR00_07365 [Streptosporangiaceae bacterium]|nr:hypothetical protein [Streptosporangiaceae bacterium]
MSGSQPPAGSASGIVQCVVLDCPDPGELAAFYAGILGAAQAQVTAAGGTLLRADPRGWRIFADVAGHPFCLLPGHS